MFKYLYKLQLRFKAVFLNKQCIAKNKVYILNENGGRKLHFFFKLKMTFVWHQEKDKPQKLALLESRGHLEQSVKEEMEDPKKWAHGHKWCLSRACIITQQWICKEFLTLDEIGGCGVLSNCGPKSHRKIGLPCSLSCGGPKDRHVCCKSEVCSYESVRIHILYVIIKAV